VVCCGCQGRYDMGFCIEQQTPASARGPGRGIRG
jgi:hypothetical protein